MCGQVVTFVCNYHHHHHDGCVWRLDILICPFVCVYGISTIATTTATNISNTTGNTDTNHTVNVICLPLESTRTVPLILWLHHHPPPPIDSDWFILYCIILLFAILFSHSTIIFNSQWDFSFIFLFLSTKYVLTVVVVCCLSIVIYSTPPWSVDNTLACLPTTPLDTNCVPLS